MISNYDQELARLIQSLYPNDYVHASFLPKPHHGSGPIKAIVIGADPTFFQDGINGTVDKVFGLEQPDSQFFRGVLTNLEQIDLSLDTIYVQNPVKNYFTTETSQNKIWSKCASLWLENLKRELDEKFDRSVPMFVTAEIILKVVVFREYLKGIKNPDIYHRNIIFSPKQNYFGRKVIPLFRHFNYQLSAWPDYADFIKEQL
jgi:hypothetical protein